MHPPVEEKKLSKTEQNQFLKQKEKYTLANKPIEHKVNPNPNPNVCTFGPTFLAKNSHTTLHLSEFWMIEPEIEFITLEDDINLEENYLKYCVQYPLEMCADDLKVFENYIS